MTKIEWADVTVNPLGGCDNASPGCDNCYARAMSHRLSAQRLPLYRDVTVNNGDGVEWTGRINFDLEPLRRLRKKRDAQRVFVASMSDWCHPGVKTSWIGEMFDEMASQDRHTFMLLTKRPGRISKVLGPDGCGFYAAEGPVPCPQPNIWLGTSIESNKYAWRAEQLRDSPAAVRFLSLEPLLGHVADLDLTGIDWVIVGGESGPRARPMHPDWVREIRHQCLLHGVAFFFKQWGSYTPYDNGNDCVYIDPTGYTFTGGEWPKDGDAVLYHGRSKHELSAVLDGQRWHQFPSPSIVSVP